MYGLQYGVQRSDEIETRNLGGKPAISSIVLRRKEFDIHENMNRHREL